jgi:hypothetical protein
MMIAIISWRINPKLTNVTDYRKPVSHQENKDAATVIKPAASTSARLYGYKNQIICGLSCQTSKIHQTSVSIL